MRVKTDGMTKYLITGLVLLFGLSGFNRKAERYPKDYFKNPVKHAIKLSGTFGELRPNHFHAGIDIRSSNGRSGDSLFAAGPGYVYRIKIEPGGYGRALYLRHPIGYTTVYAHMDQLSPVLEQYIRDKQYQAETFSVDLYPPKEQFQVARGSYIGKMGNTGHSFGPHLHFEVRDSRTDQPVNPQLFGLSDQDDVPPKIAALRMYRLGPRLETESATNIAVTQKGDTYSIPNDTLEAGAWRLGLAVKTYDYTRENNANGVYTLKMYVEDQLHYEAAMESFAFEETRYINAHMDYKERIERDAYFHRLYVLPGNQLSLYKVAINRGVIEPKALKPSKVLIVISDALGNASKLVFWVKRKEVPPAPERKFDYKLAFDQPNSIKADGMELYVPKGALYEDLWMQYNKTTSPGALSPVYSLHRGDVPLHRFISLSIQANVPDSLKSKAFIAAVSSKGRYTNCGGYWKDGKIRTRIRSLGDYCIKVDTVKPVITPVNFKPDMKKINVVRFKIRDNFGTNTPADDLQFSGTIDGKWVLFEYDSKSRTLSHSFEKALEAGKHELELTVTDDRGNASTWKKAFLR